MGEAKRSSLVPCTSRAPRRKPDCFSQDFYIAHPPGARPGINQSQTDGLATEFKSYGWRARQPYFRKGNRLDAFLPQRKVAAPGHIRPCRRLSRGHSWDSDQTLEPQFVR